MRHSLWDDAERMRTLERLRRVTPGTRPRWGRMHAGQMIVHLADQLRLALAEVPMSKPWPGPAKYQPLRWLLINVVPMPKGSRSFRELFLTPAGDFARDRAALEALLARAAARGPEGPWGGSPLFGRLSREEWGVLGWRHLDHHLRQFGV